ncbi:MAG: hypothetical protein WA728_35250, partial [Xanthobacteraceae bacterium]
TCAGYSPRRQQMMMEKCAMFSAALKPVWSPDWLKSLKLAEHEDPGSQIGLEQKSRGGAPLQCGR